MSRTALYKHWDEHGQLLYVGITNNPKRRAAEHNSRSVWAGQICRVDVVWMRSREEALMAERFAIAEENPIFNGGEHSPYVPTGDALDDWMGENGINQATLGDMIGLKQAAISLMLSGQRRVSLVNAIAIEDASAGRVPCRYWLTLTNAEASQ